MHVRLFIPGPTEVMEDVLLQQSRSMIGNRGKEMSELYEAIHENLKKLFNTDHEPIVFTSSGTGMMEGSIRNVVNSSVLAATNGAFSERWYQIALNNGKNAKKLELEWGKAVKAERVKEELDQRDYEAVTITHNETSTGVRSPIDEITKTVRAHGSLIIVDAVSSLGGDFIDVNKTDVLFASSQKAFALPPGLVITFVSDLAMEKVKTVKNRGYYFDFLEMVKYYKDKKQTPSTPAISLFYALDYQLKKMMKEGLENRYKRHLEMARFVRSWARDRFALYAEPGFESVTVTTVTNTRNIDVPKLNEELKKRGMQISNGYGKLKDKTFRIAHMGDLKLSDLKDLTETIDEILRL